MLTVDKLQFILTHDIFAEEEGIGAIDGADPLVARIERIKREQLNCYIPFDNQTMDHIGALVGAYLDLSMENYKYR